MALDIVMEGMICLTSSDVVKHMSDSLDESMCRNDINYH